MLNIIVIIFVIIMNNDNDRKVDYCYFYLAYMQLSVVRDLDDSQLTRNPGPGTYYLKSSIG